MINWAEKMTQMWQCAKCCTVFGDEQSQSLAAENATLRARLAAAERERDEAKAWAVQEGVLKEKAIYECSDYRATIAAQSTALKKAQKVVNDIFSIVSYINIHGVGVQPEPRFDGAPSPLRCSPEEFERLFQQIGILSRNALAAIEELTGVQG